MSGRQKSSLKRINASRYGMDQVVAYVHQDENGDTGDDMEEVEGLVAVVVDVNYPVGDRRRTVDLRDTRIMVYWVDKDGLPHRDDDLPAVIADGDMFAYYQHGVNWREGDKPSLVSAGVMTWYCGEKCGCFHRLGGLPAQIATTEMYGTQKFWGIHGKDQYDEDPNEDHGSKYWVDEIEYRRTHGGFRKAARQLADDDSSP